MIVAAHGFPLLGRPWSTCLAGRTGAIDWPCVVVFHVYEVPIAALFAYQAYWGLARLTRSTLGYYTCLTAFHLLTMAILATFESVVLLEALRRGAPAREIGLLYIASAGMVAGSALGFYFLFGKLIPWLLADRGAEGPRVE